MIIKAVSYTPGREATKTSCIYFSFWRTKGSRTGLVATLTANNVYRYQMLPLQVCVTTGCLKCIDAENSREKMQKLHSFYPLIDILKIHLHRDLPTMN